MNHKRKKSKRSVRCTLCTKFRWLGNHPERRRYSDRKKPSLKQELTLQ